MRRTSFSLDLVFLFVGLALALTANTVCAMPAVPEKLIVTQPDGTQFGVLTWGDERASGFETLEGYSITQQCDGWWAYITPVQSNNDASSCSQNGLRVGVDNAPAVELHLERKLKNKNAPPLKIPLEAGAAEFLQPGIKDATLSSTNLTAAANTSANNSTQPVLVILGYYDDNPPRTNPADFQAKFFGSSESVKDYYAQASYGQLALVPATENSGVLNDGIVGWVNLGKVHPNPLNQDWNATLTIAALALEAANPYVNFSTFDKDANKGISASELHIVLLIAGYEASADGGIAQPALWGHKWSLSTPVIADGMTLCSPSFKGSYTMFGEIMVDHPSTIGVMVHEMGHEFGWLDLYGTGSAGLGYWDIMSFGGWGMAAGDVYIGQTPPLPNAYLRKMLGWIDPNNPDQLLPALEYQNSPINLSISTTDPFALIMPVDPDPSLSVGEFFMVEQRERIGYDASLPGSGALVWHINESAPGNNDPRNLRVSLVQADGADHLLSIANFGDPGDAFSALSINKSFGVGTPISSAYNNGDPSNILVVFSGGSSSGFASINNPQCMGVTVSKVDSQSYKPAGPPYYIFLPLAQR